MKKKYSHSYYLREPKVESSTCFHSHVDAENVVLLEKIISEVNKSCEIAQNKIYPVDKLELGPQVKNPEFREVYDKLPNFHTINKATDEAFATGRMGEGGINYEQVCATLKSCAKYPGQGIMTEVEEDIFAMTLNDSGENIIEQDEGLTPYTMDWNKTIEWDNNRIYKIPKFELHHGFDLKKEKDKKKPPLDLLTLHELCQKKGFDLGAWFIFRKNDRWSYRCNEFSSASYENCMKRLLQQAKDLRLIINKMMGEKNSTYKSSCSLEKVHAIWKF